MHWAWPQVVWVSMMAIRLACAAYLDGEARSGKHRFGLDVIGAICGAVILYYGGFFTEVRP